MGSPKLQIPVSQHYSICKGACLNELQALPSNSVDLILTDPPYGLTNKKIDMVEVLKTFLNGEDFVVVGGGYDNHDWDSFIPGPKTWAEQYRTLKPGGYLIAFGAKRTIHYLMTAIQMGGFDIKDHLIWFHGQGNPKSTRIEEALKEAKANETVIQMFGNFRADLRPMYEPIVVAQKPIDTPNLAYNLIRHGTGPIKAAEASPSGYSGDIISTRTLNNVEIFGGKVKGIHLVPSPVLDFSKPTTKDRKKGVENLTIPGAADSRPETSSFSNKVPINRYNFHPTVKPVELMSYLVELFSIEGAIVLDPYMGSASSGIACLQKNRKFIGVELMENYFKIAQSRLECEARGLKPPKVKSSIKEQLLDNPSIHLMKEISEKMKANTATIAEYRQFDELLKKLGTIYEAA